jgi:alkanesulfonate monooxygenase SsuD/methylene tetrahydromethanopterin reductase-like flavin-dependent oxidoreductase (luciferase family)
MKFNFFILPTVPGTPEQRERLRPIGRNNDQFQEMIRQMRELAVLADDIGFATFSTTEHHLHSEGFEASIAPLMFYTDLAARTKRIKFASLGLVIPTWDPIRVAEETAVLDHLTKGRFIAGFARGYQDRWSNILGQQYHVSGTPMDGSEIDAHNRDVFEEMYRIIKMAWTEESIRFKGKYYQIPTPFDEGIRRWPIGKTWTAKYGAPGEVDAEGYVQRVSVIPKPYTQPHPPVWQPFSVSEKTIRWCAAEGILPWILISHPPSFRKLCEAYRDEGAKAGRTLRLGQHVGAHRSVHIGTTRDEAYTIGETAAGAGWPDYFAPFGFFEAFRFPGETTPVPQTYDRMIEAKFELIGTVDDIKREIEAILENSGLEWFGWYFDQGVMSWDEQRRQMDLFSKVVEEFRDRDDPASPASAAGAAAATRQQPEGARSA